MKFADIHVRAVADSVNCISSAQSRSLFLVTNLIIHSVSFLIHPTDLFAFLTVLRRIEPTPLPRITTFEREMNFRRILSGLHIRVHRSGGLTTNCAAYCVVSTTFSMLGSLCSMWLVCMQVFSTGPLPRSFHPAPRSKPMCRLGRWVAIYPVESTA
jgi:hypothetical protein